MSSRGVTEFIWGERGQGRAIIYLVGAWLCGIFGIFIERDFLHCQQQIFPSEMAKKVYMSNVELI